VKQLIIIAISLLIGGHVAAANVEIIVVDKKGRPVSGAIVTVTPENWNGILEQSISTDTDYKVVQKDMQFVPDLLVVPQGAEVRFPNMDKVRHHIYSFSPAKKFQLNLFGEGQERSVTFDNAGLVALGCNIHDQMKGYLYVNDAPYWQATDERGIASFAISTSGELALSVWHPQSKAVGKRTESTLTLSDDASISKKITLPVRSKRSAARTPY